MSVFAAFSRLLLSECSRHAVFRTAFLILKQWQIQVIFLKLDNRLFSREAFVEHKDAPLHYAREIIIGGRIRINREG